MGVAREKRKTLEFRRGQTWADGRGQREVKNTRGLARTNLGRWAWPERRENKRGLARTDLGRWGVATGQREVKNIRVLGADRLG